MLVEQTPVEEQWKAELSGSVLNAIYELLFPGIKDQSLDIKLFINCATNTTNSGMNSDDSDNENEWDDEFGITGEVVESIFETFLRFSIEN